MITLKKLITYYNWGGRFLSDPFHNAVKKINMLETAKTPTRSEIINFLIGSLSRNEITYLEIGVRNPNDNYNKIHASKKYSVDPGLEFKENPVDFKITSDDFFQKLKSGVILSPEIRFDVIFIDGLHLADQVDRDIQNSLQYIKEDGFIVLHDCNPPTEYHAREDTYYQLSPAGGQWNGTTWKAFFKVRQNKSLFSCCVDTDWGIGIISKKIKLGNVTTVLNPFFEFSILREQRENSLNLISFDKLIKLITLKD